MDDEYAAYDQAERDAIEADADTEAFYQTLHDHGERAADLMAQEIATERTLRRDGVPTHLVRQLINESHGRALEYEPTRQALFDFITAHVEREAEERHQDHARALSWTDGNRQTVCHTHSATGWGQMYPSREAKPCTTCDHTETETFATWEARNINPESGYPVNQCQQCGEINEPETKCAESHEALE